MKILLSLAFVLLLSSVALSEVFFQDLFEDKSWEQRWIHTKDSSKSYGPWDLRGDRKGLATTTDYRFYAISAPLTKNIESTADLKQLVVQFSVKHAQGIDCGGGYIKVLPATLKPEQFNGDSEYSIMFGPDICGSDRKIHLIFNYKGKNHLWKKTPTCPSDKLSHLYTLVVNPDATYEVYLDSKKVETGSLYADWDFLPAKEIADPSAKKPADWVDEKEIDDPEDKKPEDWDNEPEYIPDPDAQKPETWNDEEDGQWERPTIKNPNFKGEWKVKRIPNPAYKGEWKAPMIANPEYVHDDQLANLKNLGFVGFDLWQVKAGSIFDDIIITDNLSEAQAFAEKHFTAAAEEEKKKQEAEEAVERQRMEEEMKKRNSDKKAKKHDHDDHDHDEPTAEFDDIKITDEEKHDEL